MERMVERIEWAEERHVIMLEMWEGDNRVMVEDEQG